VATSHHVADERDRPRAEPHINERRMQRMTEPRAGQQVPELLPDGASHFESAGDCRLHSLGGLFQSVLSSDQSDCGFCCHNSPFVQA